MVHWYSPRPISRAVPVRASCRPRRSNSFGDVLASGRDVGLLESMNWIEPERLVVVDGRNVVGCDRAGSGAERWRGLGGCGVYAGRSRGAAGRLRGGRGLLPIKSVLINHAIKMTLAMPATIAMFFKLHVLNHRLSDGCLRSIKSGSTQKRAHHNPFTIGLRTVRGTVNEWRLTALISACNCQTLTDSRARLFSNRSPSSEYALCIFPLRHQSTCVIIIGWAISTDGPN